MFLMNSGQFEGAHFKSDVCQLVSVEHFSRKTYFQDGRQKYVKTQLFHCPPNTNHFFIVCFVVCFLFSFTAGKEWISII